MLLTGRLRFISSRCSSRRTLSTPFTLRQLHPWHVVTPRSFESKSSSSSRCGALTAQRISVKRVDGTLCSHLISNNRIELRRTDLSGNASSFAIPAMVVSGNRIQIDFGAHGVGGNRNSNAADGLYQLRIDADSDGSADFVRTFHRLLGDVNGDSVVDAEDRKKALSFFGQPYSAEADVNGDGLVNSADMSLLTRALGRRINSGV